MARRRRRDRPPERRGPYGVMTTLPQACSSCMERMAAGASPSGNVLATIGASFPDSRSAWRTAIVFGLLGTLRFGAGR